jgi:hypothetical protein
MKSAEKSNLGESTDSVKPPSEEDVNDLPPLREVPTSRLRHAPSEKQVRELLDSNNSEELSGLRDSIKVHGIVQPIIVRKVQKGRYEVVAGNRRLRAAVRSLSTQAVLEAKPNFLIERANAGARSEWQNHLDAVNDQRAENAELLVQTEEIELDRETGTIHRKGPIVDPLEFDLCPI